MVSWGTVVFISLIQCFKIWLFEGATHTNHYLEEWLPWWNVWYIPGG